MMVRFATRSITVEVGVGGIEVKFAAPELKLKTTKIEVDGARNRGSGGDARGVWGRDLARVPRTPWLNIQGDSDAGFARCIHLNRGLKS